MPDGFADTKSDAVTDTYPAFMNYEAKYSALSIAFLISSLVMYRIGI